MNAYLYSAALYCENCGQSIKADLDVCRQAPHEPDDETSYDSDEYPKGPYPDGGSEADSPQHCDACGMFLENPLTADDYEYVAKAVARGGDVADLWADFYDIDDTDGREAA